VLCAHSGPPAAWPPAARAAWQMSALLVAIIQRDGYSGLFRGLGSKLTQTVLNAAFIFLVYERLLGGVIRANRALRGRFLAT
jgi:hypothetical protein